MKKSTRIKITCLCYLRFDKQMPIIATECGYWNADVMGIDEKSAYEFEVKVSKADLKRDFEDKRDKHWMYCNPEQTKFTPNYMYFIVTPELEHEAIALIAEKAPRYGVYVFEEKLPPPGPKKRRKKRKGKMDKAIPRYLRLAKKAQRLHFERPSPELMETVLKRMGSELCRTYMLYEEASDRLDTLTEEEKDG